MDFETIILSAKTANGWLWLSLGVVLLADVLVFSRGGKPYAVPLLGSAILLLLLRNLIAFLWAFSSL